MLAIGAHVLVGNSLTWDHGDRPLAGARATAVIVISRIIVSSLRATDGENGRQEDQNQAKLSQARPHFCSFAAGRRCARRHVITIVGVCRVFV